jgi:hypothetical protein
MKRFKDKILEKDKVFKNILSLNILFSEMEEAAFDAGEIAPREFVAPSSKLQTKIIGIRPFHKPISKMQNLKFISNNVANNEQ